MGVAGWALAFGAIGADASWSAPTPFSGPGETAATPAVAADSAGGAAIAWSRQIDPYTSSVEVSVRTSGGVFSVPQTISVPDTGLNANPSVAVGADGTVAVIWSQEDSTAVVSFGSVAGGPFSSPTALEPTPDADGPQSPYVAIDSAGDVFAAWTDQVNVATDGGTDANTVIHYTSRPAGSASFGPTATLTSPTGQIDYPTFASAASGATVVTWSGAYVAVRPPGGQFGPAEGHDTGCVISGPDPTAIDSAGDAVVAWDSSADCENGEPVTVQSSYKPAGEGFQAAQVVAQMGGWSSATSAVMDPSGRPTIALAGTLQSPARIEGLSVLTRSSQGSWGAPQALFDTGGSANPPLSDDPVNGATLAYDSGGDLYAVWNARARNDDETADSGIYGEIQPAGGSFDGDPTQVEETDRVLNTPPVIAGAGDGNALMGWTVGAAGHYASYAAVDSTGGSDGGTTGGGGTGAGTTGGGGTGAGGGVATGPSQGADDDGGSAGATSPGTGEAPTVGEPPQAGSAGASATTVAATPTTTEPAPRPTAQPARASAPPTRRITIQGRASHARSVLITLVAGRQVIAHRRISARHGRYRTVLSVRTSLTQPMRVRVTVITAHGRMTRSHLIRT